MSTMNAADKRKMRRLEEELEEAEKQKKALTREKENLKKDFTELNEKYENIQKNAQNSEWNAKTTSTILDNKSLERTITTLEAEVDKLKKRIKRST